jgi:hypothetical protein
MSSFVNELFDSRNILAIGEILQIRKPTNLESMICIVALLVDVRVLSFGIFIVRTIRPSTNSFTAHPDDAQSILASQCGGILGNTRGNGIKNGIEKPVNDVFRLWDNLKFIEPPPKFPTCESLNEPRNPRANMLLKLRSKDARFAFGKRASRW